MTKALATTLTEVNVPRGDQPGAHLGLQPLVRPLHTVKALSDLTRNGPKVDLAPSVDQCQ